MHYNHKKLASLSEYAVAILIHPYRSLLKADNSRMLKLEKTP